MAVGADATGNVWLTGWYNSRIDLGAGAGIYATASTLWEDLYLVKLSAAGVPLWGNHFGGTGSDQPSALAVDRTDAVLVTGTTGATTLPISFGGAPLASFGARDAFVAKFTATGAPAWSTAFGTFSDDVPAGIATDASGNAVVTGSFANSLTVGSTALTSTSASLDVFAVKYTGAGAVAWAARYGGPTSDTGKAVAIDQRTGAPVIAGSFTGTGDFGSGPLTSTGQQDGIVFERQP